MSTLHTLSSGGSSQTSTITQPTVLVLRRKAAAPKPKPEKHAHIEWAEDVVEVNEFSNKRKSKSQQTDTHSATAERREAQQHAERSLTPSLCCVPQNAASSTNLAHSANPPLNPILTAAAAPTMIVAAAAAQACRAQ